MNKAYFAAAFHLHQPIGNFEVVIERACSKSYTPLIDTLFEYPQIKFTLHVSGCLLDYFEKHHPALLDKINGMCTRGQIEMMGGGYYEPILIALSPQDLAGQIDLMSKYIKNRFNQSPRGMWIPERVWAPYLASRIRDAGIEYCILDDTHLTRLGIPKENMYGYFTTGDRPKKISIFPSDKKLRYSIPFSQPSEVISYMAEVSSRHNNALFVYGDDGEKFGEWPGTYKWVFEERWLRNFLEELIRNSSWLEMAHFSDYMDTFPPIGDTEIKEASYDEMMEWDGGSWLNFFKKYPESNQMHKKMSYVSEKLEKEMALSSDKKLEEARVELYKSQCNCSYWHGVFGGLYLYHLRSAVYSHLIVADSIIDNFSNGDKKDWLQTKTVDYDMDRSKEIIVESPDFSICIDPEEGGVIKELDYRPLSVNITNALSRRRESYHKKILDMIKDETEDSAKVKTIHDDAKEIDPSISSKLIYDRYPRYFMRAYLLEDKAREISFSNSTFKELGSFSNAIYKGKIEDNTVMMEYKEKLGGLNIKLIKEISVRSKRNLSFICNIRSKGQGKLKAYLALEFNVTMPFLNSDRYNYYSDKSILGNIDNEGSSQGGSLFGIKDNEKALSLEFSFKALPDKVWYFPVKTVSQSERAYELNFQCSSISPLWKLDFAKDKDYAFEVNLAFNKG